MRHILDTRGYSKDMLLELFELADSMKNERSPLLEGSIMASLFYEPSTRTRLSFETAMIRLGGSVIGTENAKEFSSAAKGESIEDSIRVIGGYADVIVLRHPQQGTASRAAAVSPVPVINAGDGAGAHPTQALLDLYTIHTEYGDLEGKTVAIVGDLKYGRAARSLIEMLAVHTHAHLLLVSPTELALGVDIRDLLTATGTSFTETTDLRSAIESADVVYQTRIQKERFESDAAYEELKGSMNITGDLAALMKSDAIILHPLPRVDEIAPEVDHLPQARYFAQAQNGVYVRMALLLTVLHERFMR